MVRKKFLLTFEDDTTYWVESQHFAKALKLLEFHEAAKDFIRSWDRYQQRVLGGCIKSVDEIPFKAKLVVFHSVLEKHGIKAKMIITDEPWPADRAAICLLEGRDGNPTDYRPPSNR